MPKLQAQLATLTSEKESLLADNKQHIQKVRDVNESAKAVTEASEGVLQLLEQRAASIKKLKTELAKQAEQMEAARATAASKEAELQTALQAREIREAELEAALEAVQAEAKQAALERDQAVEAARRAAAERDKALEAANEVVHERHAALNAARDHQAALEAERKAEREQARSTRAALEAERDKEREQAVAACASLLLERTSVGVGMALVQNEVLEEVLAFSLANVAKEALLEHRSTDTLASLRVRVGCPPRTLVDSIPEPHSLCPHR